MKLRARARRGGVRLTGVSSASEELLYPEAEAIRCGCGDALFTFTYAPKGKGWRFEYFTGTARPLQAVLKAPLPAEHFEAMLTSFLEAGRAVDAHGLSLQRVCFQDRLLFFDPARYSLRFAYLPVRGAAQGSSSPLEALTYVAQQSRLPAGSARILAQRTLDFAKRACVFSWPEYESFLNEQGILAECRAPVDRARTADARSRPPDRRCTFGYDFINAQCSASC